MWVGKDIESNSQLHTGQCKSQTTCTKTLSIRLLNTYRLGAMTTSLGTSLCAQPLSQLGSLPQYHIWTPSEVDFSHSFLLVTRHKWEDIPVVLHLWPISLNNLHSYLKKNKTSKTQKFWPLLSLSELLVQRKNQL